MEIIMNILISLLLLFLPVVLIIGLIKPKLILRWSKKPTRWKVFGWWILLLLVDVPVIGLLADSEESKRPPTEIISLSKKDMEKGDYDYAIRRLKHIAPEDSLYAIAQEMIDKANELNNTKNKSKKGQNITVYDGAFIHDWFHLPNGIFSNLSYRASMDETKAWVHFSLKGNTMTPSSVSLIFGDNELKHNKLKGKINFSYDPENEVIKIVSIECEFEKDPTFIPERIKIITQKGEPPCYYNLKEKRWEN